MHAPSQRTAVLHIGLEKTGTTAIQQWLVAHHQQLAAAGILLPRSLGYPNHLRLMAACLDDGVIDREKGHLLRQEHLQEEPFRRWLQRSLTRELAQAPPWHTLLITSELISSRLSSPTEIERLAAFLSPHVDHIRVLLVLRRQDQLALSRFSTLLRNGFADFDAVLGELSSFSFHQLPAGRRASDEDHFYDFERIIGRYAGISGNDLVVRVYGEQSPVAMLTDVLHLPAEAGADAPRVNTAISAPAQSVLAQLNRQHRPHRPSGLRRNDYLRLWRRIGSVGGGPPRLNRRGAAEAFLERYRQGNRRVVERFGLPASLADNSGLERYPHSLDYTALHTEVAPLLSHYRTLAAALPAREPWPERLRHRRRGLVHRLELLAP